ncbi:vitamin K epoxide reductase family protein [Catalinimonas niigatensis]|uniref:vitamin K epoxide reductase family protein n=1 Tax=Catalinimonas niigatensis TaxID=1397264 RepID=UPI002665E5C9|nr:vitamin K epoxide reductase family protein [Catalinimonas niigatensis]WPP51878.1 vitamin K epoxide reductase family protein [Catalinimonas niigatensis]WPP52657.1 vitamin K epoxide reductase family protein [Catalinimonas niigatensis]
MKEDDENRDRNKGQQSKKKQKPKQGGMAMRGVSRPMAENQIRQHHQKQQDKQQDDQHSKSEEHQQHGGGHQMMSHDQRMQMLHMHHMQTLWVYWMLVMLGFWMVLSPLTFSYAQSMAEPSGGREIWLSLSQRAAIMTWSDIISGLLLIFFGWRSLTPNRPVSMWICCFVGVWLSIAPLVFWAPNAAAYINDTLVGVLVIGLTILIPGMPNMITYMKMGSEVPPGWSYNPSSWPQRWIMIVAGFIGWMVSRYLGAYQLGYIDQIWDPFFGEGSRLVLDSNMSHSLPVSDGGMGALAYTFEFLMGWMGAPTRWRTMPWMVTFFGILVIPLGLVHIFLVISQPVVVGYWCTFCLLAAAVMLPMIPLEIDEVVAMGQHMVQAKKRGDSFWKVFWKGGKPIEHNMDERSPKIMELPQHPWKVFKASIWGMSFPWTLVVSTVLGIWLMCAPAVFGVGIEASAADVNHLGGSLIVVVSVICMGEVVRIGRYINVLLGLAVAVLPWLVQDSNLALNISGAVAGLAVAALSIPRGPVKESYGLWNKYVR